MIWIVSGLGVVIFVMGIILYKFHQRVNELENAVVYLMNQIEDDGDVGDFLTEFGKGFVRGFFGG
ncbi:hypothetical protein [uncultured Campylobacter sp.]|uniref:hypothetical protein n=1 Tax=uncultured Campylobacter sp. TaxID=218934 RepID=UPI002615F7FA|nr:hypothetical protein [uncultured Campylobacter sp.]